jgi:hypothetical protein
MESYSRSLLFRIAHRALPVLAHQHTREHYNVPARCLFCQRDDETLEHLFGACTALRRLWNIIQPCADALGLTDSREVVCRASGLLGRVDISSVQVFLPAPVPAPRVRAVVMKAWTELRAVVLTAIWRCRLDLLFKRVPRRDVAKRNAARLIESKLRCLLFAHLPTLSPWPLDAAPRNVDEQALATMVWTELATLIKH